MINRLGDVSLRAKITISFVLIVVFGTAISTLIGSQIVTRAMRNEALKQTRRGLNAAEMIYDARLEAIRKSIAAISATEQLSVALSSGRSDYLARTLARLRDENRLEFLTFVDANRRRVVRALGPGFAEHERYPSAIGGIIDEAFSGKTSASSELFSAEALAHEDPVLAERVRIAIDPQRAGSETPEVRQNGMVLCACAPITTGAGFMGVLYGGILLNREQELVDQISDFVFGKGDYASAASGTVSIFAEDVLIATNVRDASGRAVLGTRASQAIRQAVLSAGQVHFGREHIAGRWHLIASKPIRSQSGRILGILYLGIPEDPFLEVRTSMMLTFLVVAGVGVAVVLLITYFITRSMIHPLEEIVRVSNRIAAGDLDQTVNITSRDEIGILANSFNKMLTSIKAMKLELEEWGRTLEEKVNKRTEELVAVQTQMAQSEKLASLGRLAAGVAHEINNPLGGILAFGMLALEECDDDHPLKQNLEVIVKQTLRCRETVKGLLDFARQSNAAPTITEVNSVVDKTLQLLENQIIFQNIRTVRKFDPELPPVLIDPGQLQQVIMNIVLNAVDAMEENGVLTIETFQAAQGREIGIRISDTGKGIPEDILPLIFEPFFTTKKVGKGTGLGLAIVHGIVTRAGGTVEAASSSKGATFTIRLPAAQEEAGKVDGTPVKGTNYRAGQPHQRG